MEFLKKLFNDDEKIVGLCGFKEKVPETYRFDKSPNLPKLVYGTNTKLNFLLS